MSYDITIAFDETWSKSVDLVQLKSFIATLPQMEPNGERGLALCEGDRLWMEIDLETVNEEGDAIDDGEGPPTVNCVRLHIPYPVLGDNPERDYFPTALAIAEHLDWPAIDDQSGEPLKSSSNVSKNVTRKAPWWKWW